MKSIDFVTIVRLVSCVRVLCFGIGEAWVRIPLSTRVSSIEFFTTNNTKTRTKRHENSTTPKRFGQYEFFSFNKWNLLCVYVDVDIEMWKHIFFCSDDLQMQQPGDGRRRRRWFDYIYSFHFIACFFLISSSTPIDWILKLPSMTCKFLALNEPSKNTNNNNKITHSKIVFLSYFEKYMLWFVWFVGVVLSCDFVLGIFYRQIFFFYFFIIHLDENSWNTLNTMTQTEFFLKKKSAHVFNEQICCLF